MGRTYAIAEARANLPTIVDEVEAGAAVQFTRRGKVIAVMISIGEYERLRRKRTTFQDAYQQFLKKHSLEQAGIEPGFVDRLRDRSAGRKTRL